MAGLKAISVFFVIPAMVSAVILWLHFAGMISFVLAFILFVAFVAIFFYFVFHR